MKVAIIGAGHHEKEALVKLIEVVHKLNHEVIIIDNSPPNDIGSMILKTRNLIDDPICIVEGKSKYHK